MSEKLALLGGQPVISRPLAPYRPHGEEERRAALGVLESGVLSSFYGSWGDQFLGGPKVREFESEWKKTFHVESAISVNSATSGLICAVGAIPNLEPGDEVIVSPWTMSATAMAILVWNAIPVFADIEPRTFNLCPESVRRNISRRTKAILVTDIFGHGAELEELRKIADERGILLIEDASQSPGARVGDRYVGTVGDIGVFSLNYHKHIHTGEGGMCVTNMADLATRMQLIRNHAESVAGPMGRDDFQNLIGFNFRLGEIEAAIGIEQLKKLKSLAGSRSAAGLQLSEKLNGLAGLEVPFVRRGCTHVYYVWGAKVDPAKLGVSRAALVRALAAEGVDGVLDGYVNIHKLPIFQKKIAYGSGGFPWKSGVVSREVSYEHGVCPVAEEMQEARVLGLQLCAFAYDAAEVDLVAKAFCKVWDNLDGLRGLSER